MRGLSQRCPDVERLHNVTLMLVLTRLVCTSELMKGSLARRGCREKNAMGLLECFVGD